MPSNLPCEPGAAGHIIERDDVETFEAWAVISSEPRRRSLRTAAREAWGRAITCNLKLDDGPWATAYYQSVETEWGDSYSADNQYEYKYASGKYIRDFHNLPNG